MFTSSLRLTSRVCLVPAFQFVLESHTNRTNGMWEMWKNACTICWCWCCVEYVAHCKSINIHRHTQAQLTHFTLILSFNFRKPKYNNMAAMELSSSFVHFARLLCFSLNRRIAAFSLSLSFAVRIRTVVCFTFPIATPSCLCERSRGFHCVSWFVSHPPYRR